MVQSKDDGRFGVSVEVRLLQWYAEFYSKLLENDANRWLCWPKAKDENNRQDSWKILGQSTLFTYHLGAISFDETQTSRTISHNKT